MKEIWCNKVLKRTEKGELVSAVATPPAMVKYVPGKRAVAPIGELFVFGEFDDARSFGNVIIASESVNVLEIWYGTCGNLSEVGHILLSASDISDKETLLNYWLGNSMLSFWSASPPSGTKTTPWFVPKAKIWTIEGHGYAMDPGFEVKEY